MKASLMSWAFVCISTLLWAQTPVVYEIDFSEAAHHEAVITVEFSELERKPLKVTMPRSSPGRYAIHEFAKNVYGVKASNEQGEALSISRPDPYSWIVEGHEGYVKVEYHLFANRGDGTYSQIDLTHAHLNMPATFMFSEYYANRPIQITFQSIEKRNWKVATQLKALNGNTFYAPDLQYFMDSPTEVSAFSMREWEVDGQTIRFALHHEGTEQELDQYSEQVKKIVEAERDVFGELPRFDFGEYTFLACYMPHVSGDGMEHRNSTILTSTRSLAEGGMTRNLGTVSHEFFHAWNVERIRPASLEPFDFTQANMSGELWFAEGFTSYYTNLILCRAGLMAESDYVSRLQGTINYVVNSPGRKHFNPIEMSYKAPFVDAASSIDPTNWENTFISYYTYGSALGLALDLSLRNEFEDKTLDGYMQHIWKKFGKTEVGYTVKNLEAGLAEFTNPSFAKNFFGKYVFRSEAPDYQALLSPMGVKVYVEDDEPAYLGTRFYRVDAGIFEVVSNPAQDSPAWDSGLQKGDRVIAVNGRELGEELRTLGSDWKAGATITLTVARFGKTLEVQIIPANPKSITTAIDGKAKKLAKTKRSAWLTGKK